jgi:hypothetical protein
MGDILHVEKTQGKHTALSCQLSAKNDIIPSVHLLEQGWNIHPPLPRDEEAACYAWFLAARCVLTAEG